MKVKVYGIPELYKALKSHQRALGAAFEHVSADVADTFLRRNDVFVPLETGALRASGVWVQEGSGFNTVTFVGYGADPEGSFYRQGRDTPQEPHLYAKYQEETHETKKTAFTVWYYLESGIRDFFQDGGAMEIIVAELSKV